jgi:hypothetical protein
MLLRSLFMALIAVACSGPAFAEIARVKTVTGPANVLRGTASQPARTGQLLQPGDVLVTGKTGRMSLSFVDNTRFAIGPNSRVAVSHFSYDKTRQTGAFVTQVDRGSLAVVSGRIAKSGRDAMKVRTPTSLLGVRGTRFIVDVPQ